MCICVHTHTHTHTHTRAHSCTELRMPPPRFHSLVYCRMCEMNQPLWQAVQADQIIGGINIDISGQTVNLGNLVNNPSTVSLPPPCALHIEQPSVVESTHTHTVLTMLSITVCDNITLTFHFYKMNGTSVFIEWWKNAWYWWSNQTKEVRTQQFQTV